jgi:cytidylate kinase
MAQLASEVGLSEDEVVDYSEMDHQSQNILDRLVSLLTTAPGESPAVGQVSTWQRDATGTKVRAVEEVGKDRSVAVVGQTILAARKVGNVVIVGRGGQAVLGEKPGVLHVRVEAPSDLRVQRVQEQQKLSQRDAERLVKERDRASAHYVKRFHDVDLSDSMLYHLVINTGRWETEAAAQLIVSALSHLPALPTAA